MKTSILMKMETSILMKMKTSILRGQRRLARSTQAAMGCSRRRKEIRYTLIMMPIILK
jgi:hypothetical protein